MNSNTILYHMYKGTINANDIAEFLEELYDNILNHQEYNVEQGTSEIGVEIVKNALCSEYNDGIRYVTSISFNSLKSIKTDDKIAWMMYALQAHVSFSLSYINKLEETRMIVKSFAKSASEKELYAMREAFEIASTN